eukprot:1813878-Rhodomonas_salina.1
MRSQVRETGRISHSLDPEWDEEFSFKVGTLLASTLRCGECRYRTQLSGPGCAGHGPRGAAKGAGSCADQ